MRLAEGSPPKNENIPELATVVTPFAAEIEKYVGNC
jgi:hypothetical protein